MKNMKKTPTHHEQNMNYPPARTHSQNAIAMAHSKAGCRATVPRVRYRFLFVLVGDTATACKD